jgi:predicted alpha/beta superfamily hydrolase
MEEWVWETGDSGVAGFFLMLHAGPHGRGGLFGRYLARLVPRPLRQFNGPSINTENAVMKALALSAVLSLSGILTATGVHADEGAASPPAEATIESTHSFDFVSKFTGESYRIKILVPRAEAPAAGYPVLYLLDGNLVFGTFSGAVWNEAKSSEMTSAVVVGIESGPGENGGDRALDFTPQDMTEAEKKIVVDLGGKLGGYDKFINTIQKEIKPRVERMIHIDKRHESLFGWSLGGQFVIHTMLVHPDYFSCYLALSPSLWLSDRAVFHEIPAFEKAVASGARPVSLFIGVGSLEEVMSPGMRRWHVDQSRFADELNYDRMVGNVQDFTALMQPFFEKHGMAFESKIFEGETHNTAPWAAVNPMLRFALPLDNPK